MTPYSQDLRRRILETARHGNATVKPIAARFLVVRSAAARTTEAVYAAFASGLHDVTLEDIAGWFGDRAAYAMQL